MWAKTPKEVLSDKIKECAKLIIDKADDIDGNSVNITMQITSDGYTVNINTTHNG